MMEEGMRNIRRRNGVKYKTSLLTGELVHQDKYFETTHIRSRLFPNLPSYTRVDWCTKYYRRCCPHSDHPRRSGGHKQGRPRWHLFFVAIVASILVILWLRRFPSSKWTRRRNTFELGMISGTIVALWSRPSFQVAISIAVAFLGRKRKQQLAQPRR